VDGLDIGQTAQLLRVTWPQVRQALLVGTYWPQPVWQVKIPNPDGSQRELGIPTVLDRLIQRALLQLLQPLTDREGRAAGDGVAEQAMHRTEASDQRSQERGGQRLRAQIPGLRAVGGRGPSGVPLPTRPWTSSSRTARCGPARRMVWEGPGQRDRPLSRQRANDLWSRRQEWGAR